MNNNALTQTAPGLGSPPKWFWLVSVLGLLWNGLGVMAFFGQMTMELSQLPDAQRVFHETTPLWAHIAFGVAVFGGVLGCVALLLRKAWAVPMLLLCLAGIATQVFHSLVLANGLAAFGPQGIVLPTMTFTIGALLAWFAYESKKRGWIGASETLP